MSQAAATLDDFLRPFVRRYKRGVPLPLVGLVTLGNVHEGERQAIQRWGEKKGNEDKVRARWFVECVYRFDPANPDDPNPPRLFTLEHIPALAALDSAIAMALIEAINRHCWLDLPDLEDLEKNSVATTPASLPSS